MSGDQPKVLRHPATTMPKQKTAGESSTIDPSSLGVYFTNPANHPNVVGSNEDFVIVNDIYPKTTIHLLILPRDPIKRKEHPLDAFQDREFLDKCKKEASKWRLFAADQLKDKICGSQQPVPHNWELDIMVGIHSQPSMDDLHIHVISRDLYSDFLWEKTNYTSFTTSFFVRLEEFPLNEEEEAGRVSALKNRDMSCSRCSETFRTFKKLKSHLKLEFTKWKNKLIDSSEPSREQDSGKQIENGSCVKFSTDLTSQVLPLNWLGLIVESYQERSQYCLCSCICNGVSLSRMRVYKCKQNIFVYTLFATAPP